MHGLSSATFVDTCLVFAMSPPYPTMSALGFAKLPPTFAAVAASSKQASRQADSMQAGSRHASRQAGRALTGSLCAALLRWHALRCQDGNHMPLDMPVSNQIMPARGCYHALGRLDSILSVALGCRSTHSYCSSHAKEWLMGSWQKDRWGCCSCC